MWCPLSLHEGHFSLHGNSTEVSKPLYKKNKLMLAKYMYSSHDYLAKINLEMRWL